MTLGLQAEILRDVEAGHAAALPGIVDRIDIAPFKARVRERPGGAFRLDLQRADGAFHVAGRVFVDADDGRITRLGGHVSTTPCSTSLRMAGPE